MASTTVTTLEDLKHKNNNIVLKLKTVENKFLNEKKEILKRVRGLLASDDERKDIYQELHKLLNSEEDSEVKTYLKQSQLDLNQIIELTEAIFEDNKDQDIVLSLIKENGLLNLYIVFILQKYQEKDDELQSMMKDLEIAQNIIEKREQDKIEFFKRVKQAQEENKIVLNNRQKILEKNIFKKISKCGRGSSP